MTNLYLLFQWTEERDAKNHIGIYSTIEKAKEAAQRSFDSDCTGDGQPTRPLVWETTSPHSLLAMAQYENDPYDIEEFDLDVFIDVSECYSGGRYDPNKIKQVHL